MVRRFLVVLVVVVLGLSVLVGVGSPVGAANTASEVLFDHDGDPDTSSVRRFGGSNRYATSVALAEAFVGSVGSGGFVDSVIVASGVSVVDAAAAAGLAASKSAPVLLTTPNRLSAAVEDFIVDEFITDVFIVGGVEAVSQAVEDALSELVTVRSVKRLGGVDRYASSVVLAEELGSPGVFCQSGLVTAVLVNADVSFADVIAVGPLAYALELPVLLTRVDELPVGVAAYLVDAEVERVVVVGGEAAVSPGVVDDLALAGVDDVLRVSGENRFATAVEVLNALDDCATVSLNASQVALINADAAADGVSAAPFLGSGADGVTAVLLVQTDQLPAETSDYLASIPARSATAAYVDQSITAIGGTAVVSAGVMQAAINAATTSEPLTATVKAKIDASSFTITFSNHVVTEMDEQAALWPNSALNKANYRVAGKPLLNVDTITLNERVATITLSDAGDQLAVGTTISVLGGKIKGNTGDNRRVEAVTYTIAPLVPDNVRPNVRIIAADNGHVVRILATDLNLVIPPRLDGGQDTIDIFDGIKLQRNGVPIPTKFVQFVNAAVSSGPGAGTGLYVELCLNGSVGTWSTSNGFPPVGTHDCINFSETEDVKALSAGERITLESGAFVDEAGNESRTTSVRVAAFGDVPRVTRATVSKAITHRTFNFSGGPELTLAEWSWLALEADGTDADTFADTKNNLLTFVAKPDAAAGGALGNGWYVDWFELPADTDTDPEVSVNVITSRSTVRVGFDDDATLYTAVTALLDSEEVTELFTITSDALDVDSVANKDLTLSASTVDCFRPVDGTSECGQPTIVRRRLTGGASIVEVTLSFNGIVQNFAFQDLIRANRRTDSFPFTTDDVPFGNYPFRDAFWLGTPTTSVIAPDNKLTFELYSTNPLLTDLPRPGDTISLPAGLAFSYDPIDPEAAFCDTVTTCKSSVAVPKQRLRAG